MQKQCQNLNEPFFVLFLLVIFFSVQLTIPIQSTAQSIFSSKPRSYPNDDKNLCEGINAPRRNDKYCEYYIGYRNSETVNPSSAAEYRNKMLYLIKEEIDDYYNAYKNGRKVKTRWFQTLLDILGIGLAFTGTVAGGERVKTVLGATSGSFQAGRNSINDRFQLLQYQILINKMNANRLEQWTEIVKNMEKDTKDFPWDSSREQLQQYLFRGNFEDALDTLVNETGAEVTNAEKNLNILGAVSENELEIKFRNFDGYIRPMFAISKKLDVDIERVKGEVEALPAGDAKVAKQKELDSVITQKQNLIKNYQTISLAILASEDFATIEEKIKTKFAESPNVLLRFNTFLTNLRNKREIKAEEYDQFLLFVNGAVGSDATLNTNFLKILDANKLPEEE